MIAIYLWVGGLGGALCVLGCIWFRDKMDDLEDTMDRVEFELSRLREEVKECTRNTHSQNLICDFSSTRTER